jgi:methyltransferase family protein
MLAASRKRILEQLGDDDVVLDIGGAADPFWRADWVIDLIPYESRGVYERRGWIERSEPGPPERFSARTWIQRDLCDREPFPFRDGEIDFVVCSQTLEELRDPVWVCREMVRIGKAGYIEVPSRLEEQSWGVYGEFVGWPHHHWLVDVEDRHIEFVFKDHELHSDPRCFFPRGFWAGLGEEERVQTLWWQESFAARERVFLEERPGERYLPELVERELGGRTPHRRDVRGLARRFRRRLRAGW